MSACYDLSSNGYSKLFVAISKLSIGHKQDSQDGRSGGKDQTFDGRGKQSAERRQRKLEWRKQRQRRRNDSAKGKAVDLSSDLSLGMRQDPSGDLSLGMRQLRLDGSSQHSSGTEEVPKHSLPHHSSTR